MARLRRRPPDVEKAARRLRRPWSRVALAGKRVLDVALAIAMLIVLAPVGLLVAVLLLAEEGEWTELRVRIGRDGRLLRLRRFRPLPGRIGEVLERAGVRDLPLLISVIAGDMSLVGPRPLPPQLSAEQGGVPRLMAPGLTGPAQQWANDPESAAELDEAYVREWTLRGDVLLLARMRSEEAYLTPR